MFSWYTVPFTLASKASSLVDFLSDLHIYIVANKEVAVTEIITLLNVELIFQHRFI